MRRPSRSSISLFAILALAGCDGSGETTADGVPIVRVQPDGLQRALGTVTGPVELRLEPGEYVLQPDSFTDPTCGNCQDPATPVPATVGARITGEGIRIVGAGTDSVVIRTNAGYGLFFDGCDRCALKGVTVTGGERDRDGQATDAGVVVRDGRVGLRDCAIRDNVGDSATVAETVVGIAGIVGREGAVIDVEGCHITRNSWDGVALYRGASATIRNTVIDGVDAARGGAIGGGRGVGIGSTWDARARIRGTLIRNYWKGIGAFVDAEVDARENIVEDVLTWGLAYWGPDGSAPRGEFRDNAVYRTGACGASVDRTAEPAPDENPGALVGNVFVATGQDERYDTGEPYCWQRAIARHAVPPGFEIGDNWVHDAREPGDQWPTQAQVDGETLAREAEPLLEALARWPALGASSFLKTFGPQPGG